MMNTYRIKNPEFLHIKNQDTISYGANQDWYQDEWQRRAGCGPTTTSNILWYLAQSRTELCKNLCSIKEGDFEEMLALMEVVWNYVTPTRMGVNKASILTDGAIAYAKEKGINMTSHVIEISEDRSLRPEVSEVQVFLNDALSRDLPVAFLNLCNGAVENLDKWHWVTLIGTDKNLQAVMYDQSIYQTIDLAKWINTTTLGGAFVCLDVCRQEQEIS